MGNQIHKTTGNFEWYTPKFIIDAARETMGGIDLDPASCAFANHNLVGAGKFYDMESNGLAQFWSGRVWLNPPYQAKLLKAFIEKLLETAAVDQACVLTNNIADTRIGQALLAASSAVCFPAGRIKFIDASGQPAKTPMQGQMICGIGVNTARFYNAFRPIGAVL